MRALLLVLDSVGVGGAPDAARFGDEGAATLQHILKRCPGTRLPTLMALGLGRILGIGGEARASWGRMREVSAGKDSTTGHWEIAGILRREGFATFDRFPQPLIDAIEGAAGVRFLGNVAASGTGIIQELGEEHLRTGQPLLYTSADSVLQIAAHEEVIPVERLYEICRIARRYADPYHIGRVIARPFVGPPGHFTRTPRRHDFSIAPPRTLLDALLHSGEAVIGVGKVLDLFAGRGFSQGFPTGSNAEGMRRVEAVWAGMARGLLFANLVDFDTEFGHRRDVAGYASALETFDAWLAGFVRQIAPDDLVIVTADHGNDPTFRGTDHTREEVPLLVIHRGTAAPLGVRETFADVAATLAEYFELEGGWEAGRSFLQLLRTETCAHGDIPVDSARGPSARERHPGGADRRGANEPAGLRAGAADGGARGGAAGPGAGRARDLLESD